jgi:competence protein ComEA
MHRKIIHNLAWVLAVVWLGGLSTLAAEGGSVVNINAASIEELALLPRVGESVAQRIVDFRDKNGRFKNVEDLMLVRGIGEKTFELIKPHVSLTGETTLREKVTPPKTTAKTGD